MESGSITGGPIRFHEVSGRWACDGLAEQRLMTTPGGAGMLRRMGCALPLVPVRASLGARRELFRASRLWSYLLSALDGRRAIARARLPGPDVVITVSDYFCDIVPALAAKRRDPRCRWVAWIHHKELPPGERPGNRAVNTLMWRLQEWSLTRIAARADAAWVYDTDAGDRVRDRLLAYGMAAGSIRRMRCGIDLAAIRQAPQPAKTVDAVMVGVRPNKGLHDIIPVWEALQRLRPGTTLRLMGGMSGEATLLAEIRRKRLDGVIEVFRAPGGYLASEAYYAKLKEARLLFAPSHEEGWGIALCEAMACGLPVVAYDLPVYRRIYGDAIRAVPCFDTQAFADRLADVASDAALEAALRAAGWLRAAAYDWQAIAGEDAVALGLVARQGSDRVALTK